MGIYGISAILSQMVLVLWKWRRLDLRRCLVIRLWRLTQMMRGGELGVSFLSLDSSGDPGNLARQLECYAVLQKYAERCPTWVALAADVASSRIIDLCKFLSGPWQKDVEVERLADLFIPTRAQKDESA